MLPAAIPFPDLSPELFSIEIGGFAFALRWYALAYIAGLMIAWWLAARAVSVARLWPADRPPITRDQVEELMTWVILGVVIGGRLGFVLFYQPAYYLANPAQIPMIWQGGMAFHGGFLGVVVAGLLFCRKHDIAPMSAADMFALATPPGLMLGRIANFINAELWGRPTDVPWGVILPGTLAQDCPGPVGLVEIGGQVLCARHPSQLYEAALEGALLLILAFYLVYRRGWFKTPGAITGVFLATYGIGRFIVELVRQPNIEFVTPDNPIGHAILFAPGIGLTMGQVLSLPMIAIGLALVVLARRRAA